MPQYTVRFRRATIEYCSIQVDADDPVMARRRAWRQVRNDDDGDGGCLEWCDTDYKDPKVDSVERRT